MSYDAGFATISSTSSYYTTLGTTVDDDTYQVFIYAPFTYYYTGAPINPRFVSTALYTQSDRTFSQELRLLSHHSTRNRCVLDRAGVHGAVLPWSEFPELPRDPGTAVDILSGPG